MLWSMDAGSGDCQLLYDVPDGWGLLAVQVQKRQRKGYICRSHHHCTTGNRHGEKCIAVLMCTSITQIKLLLSFCATPITGILSVLEKKIRYNLFGS
jgi:hypothetical protein